MLDYLNTPFDLDDEALASAFDEVSVWSHHFGTMLLDNVILRPKMTVLDIGFGTGFPMLELSQRLGPSSRIVGIDPWAAAIPRARFKADTLGIDNIDFVQGDAACMRFEDETFDLIISNVGVNNFERPRDVLRECYRTARIGAQVALTTNPKGHMQEFYDIFGQTLMELGMLHLCSSLEEHVNHRHTVEKMEEMLQTGGFEVTAIQRGEFSWRFADGSAFMRHHLVKRAFVPSWASLLPDADREHFFSELEANLNASASSRGVFYVTVPTAYIEATKPG